MRRYCKGGFDLKHTRRRVVRLSVTSEMGEGGREAAVSCQIEVLTKGFLQYDDGLVKAAKHKSAKPTRFQTETLPKKLLTKTPGGVTTGREDLVWTISLEHAEYDSADESDCDIRGNNAQSAH